mmetsp:Transcript_20257/g.61493  ORF Transcript_20257/g.61493 Transcript_20257/m.61493 type:complete len:227 (+) Transcript_20257:1339-2019(+)
MTPRPAQARGVSLSSTRAQLRTTTTRISRSKLACTAATTGCSPCAQVSSVAAPRLSTSSPSRSPAASAGLPADTSSTRANGLYHAGAQPASPAEATTGAAGSASVLDSASPPAAASAACSSCSNFSICPVISLWSVRMNARRWRWCVTRYTSMSARGKPSRSTSGASRPAAGAPPGPGLCSSATMPDTSSSSAERRSMRSLSCSRSGGSAAGGAAKPLMAVLRLMA